MKKIGGFTIAESLFAMVILSLIMMAIFYLFPSVAMAQKKAECRIVAASVAQSNLEFFRNKFDNIVVGPGALKEGEWTQGEVKYVYSVDEFVPGINAKYLRGVRATVMWEFRSQQFQLVEETWVSSSLMH